MPILYPDYMRRPLSSGTFLRSYSCCNLRRASDLCLENLHRRSRSMLRVIFSQLSLSQLTGSRSPVGLKSRSFCIHRMERHGVQRFSRAADGFVQSQLALESRQCLTPRRTLQNACFVDCSTDSQAFEGVREREAGRMSLSGLVIHILYETGFRSTIER